MRNVKCIEIPEQISGREKTAPQFFGRKKQPKGFFGRKKQPQNICGREKQPKKNSRAQKKGQDFPRHVHKFLRFSFFKHFLTSGQSKNLLEYFLKNPWEFFDSGIFEPWFGAKSACHPHPPLVHCPVRPRSPAALCVAGGHMGNPTPTPAVEDLKNNWHR